MKVELTTQQVDLLLTFLNYVRNSKVMEAIYCRKNVSLPPRIRDLCLILADSLDYKDYLETTYWKTTKELTKNRDRGRCRFCGIDEEFGGAELHVHHNSYENKGYEDKEDLITLCRECHQLFHDNKRVVPQPNESH